MKGDIHNWCTVGLIHSQAYPESNKSGEAFLRTLRKIAADDWFDLVEISQIPFPEVQKEVLDMIDVSHLEFVYCGHSRLFKNRLNPNSLIEEERKKAEEELLRGLEEAHAFGSRQYQFLTRNYEEGKVGEGLSQLAKTVRAVCRKAREYSMEVVIELFDWDIDKKSLLGPSQRAAEFYDMVHDDCPNFGWLVDLSHIPLIHESIEENIEPIRDQIRHIHIGSAQMTDRNDISYGDMHPRFGYPNGENDIPEVVEFLRKLIEIGYLEDGGERIVSFEIKPQGDEDPDLVVANAKRVLRRAWKRV